MATMRPNQNEASPSDMEPYLAQIEAFNPTIRQHADHAWRQVGRCVYCECGERLYQGTKPAQHPTYTPPRKPSPADEMRARWGKP